MVRKVEGPSIPPSPASRQSETATVRQGDTVSTIAARHKVSEQDLISSNPQIKDSKRLSPGQELMLPQHKPEAGRTNGSSGSAYGGAATSASGAAGRPAAGTAGAGGASGVAGTGAGALAARGNGFSSGGYAIEEAGVSVGRQLENISQLTSSEGFRQLSTAHQQQMSNAVGQRPVDRNFAREITTLANNSTFRGLSDADKTQLIDNVSTHSSASAYIRSLNNDQLLTLAESPSGPNQLTAMREAIQSGGITRAEQAQLNRIGTATFTPGAGLTVNGSAADQASYLHMVRREMLNSPSFAKLMNIQNADTAHPVTINVDRSQPNTFVDAFNGGGNQTIDLDDFERWPENPSGSPHAMTRGQNLVHAMAEARQGALGNGYDVSHRRAIQAENQYRADIGQTSRLRLFPNDTTHDAAGNTIFQYDNGYKELIEKDPTGTTITGIVHIIPLGLSK